MQQPATNYNIIDHPPMQLTIFILTGYLDSGMLCLSLIPVIDPALDTKVIKCKLTQYLWSNFNHNFSPDNTCTYSLVCMCSKCSQLSTANQGCRNIFRSGGAKIQDNKIHAKSRRLGVCPQNFCKLIEIDAESILICILTPSGLQAGSNFILVRQNTTDKKH